jgi:hypothetical protein
VSILIVFVLCCLVALALAQFNVNPNCDCIFNWVGPEIKSYTRLNDLVYANYHNDESWSPNPGQSVVPCETCFVNIQTRGLIFVDQFVQVNELKLGGNLWDDTILVVGGTGRPSASLRVGMFRFSFSVFKITLNF